MIKFLLVLLFFVLMSAVFYFYVGRYFGGKNFEVAMKAGGKIEQWSETKRRRFVIAVRLFFKAIAVALLIFDVVPMVRDIPDLQKGRFEVIEGVPEITLPSPWVRVNGFTGRP